MIRRAALAALGLAACATAPQTPGEGNRLIRGLVPDGGFGARLATDGERLWIAAPFAGIVYAAAGGPVAEGAAGSFTGAGLAWTAEGLAVGAPVPGTVTVDGQIELSEAGVGGIVVVGPGGWVASTPTGWVAADGTRGDLGRCPDALLFGGSTVLAGAAFGPVATWSGSTPTPRTTETDEAGATLLLCDTDGDGTTEVVVGAPGSGEVRTRGVVIASGSGRFGAALACGTAPGVLYVGAPADGELHAGALYVVDHRGTPAPILVGAPFDELGTAVAVAAGWVYAGAPGPAAAPGYVRGVPEP